MIAFGVTMAEEHTLRLSRRQRDEILKTVYYAVGWRWQEKWLPRHFSRRARERYNYGKRSIKWQQRKLREAKTGKGKVKKGGRVDIVYTGLAESLFAKRHAVRAFPTRATINMHGPRYIGMRPRGKSRHAIGQEITRVIEEEVLDLDQVAQATLEALLKSTPSKRTIIRPRGAGGKFES